MFGYHHFAKALIKLVDHGYWMANIGFIIYLYMCVMACTYANESACNQTKNKHARLFCCSLGTRPFVVQMKVRQG